MHKSSDQRQSRKRIQQGPIKGTVLGLFRNQREQARSCGGLRDYGLRDYGLRDYIGGFHRRVQEKTKEEAVQ